AYLPAEACDPTEDSDAVLAGQITDPTTTSDPNAGDPDDLNTETRSSDPTSHLDGWGDDEGEQGLYPEGVVLIDSWPKNNATAVSRTARFWVKFPHNVADSASFDLNTSKVSLIKADGTPVPCTVYTLDRQLYPETRRFIFIQPTSALDWGTKYKIVVLPGVMAHNMNSSYETYVITFSTEVNPFASGGGSASVPAPTGSGIGFYSKVQAAKAGSGGSSTDSGVAGGLVSVGLSEGSSGSSDQSLGAVSETTGAEEGGIVGSIMLLAEVGTPQSANADEEVGGRAPVLPGIIFGAAAAFLLASIFELMRRLDYNKSLRQGE
ncbi:MAG: Ig-like domain-containing protein, partial [Actinobacteria bacterium]|nr:Ig-like domain-containing protein [Actinomycetota bacterium]